MIAPPLTAVPSAKPSVALGALLIVAAFACVAVMSAFAKGADGVSTGTLAFFQNAISFALLAPWALHKGVRELKTARLPLHLLRAGAGLLSQVLMFVAVKKMPLVDAVLLANSAPLFIPLVAWGWLKKRVSAVVIISLVIGFGGVILVLRPGLAMFTHPAAFIALAAALFSAFALVSVNQLSQTEPAPRVLFYYFLVSSIAAAPFAVWTWKSPTKTEWLLLCGVGLTMAASQFLILAAYRRATAGRIAAFNYTVVIFSGLIGWIIWKNTPSWLSLVGVLLVTAGGVLSTAFGAAPAGSSHLASVNHSREDQR